MNINAEKNKTETKSSKMDIQLSVSGIIKIIKLIILVNNTILHFIGEEP